MGWRPGKNGWGGGEEESVGNWLRQVIHTTIEVVKGGVLRAGKTAYTDDAHVGFWLGVDYDGKAKFNIGGPAYWLKWTGTQLEIQGFFRTPTVNIDDEGLAITQGELESNQLRFVDVNGEALGVVGCTQGPWLALVTAVPKSAGDLAMIDLWLDGDPDSSVGLRLRTVKGGGPASSELRFYFGNVVRAFFDVTGKLTVRGGLDASNRKIVNVAAPVAVGDAVNLGVADGRYLPKAGGWSGSFRTDEINAVTVVDGQIVGVA